MNIEEFILNKQSIISSVLGQYLGDVPTNDGLVTLFDLIDQVYGRVYNQVKLEELKSDKDFLRDFLVDINGCYSEARIGKLLVNGDKLNSSNVPSDFGDIDINTDQKDNPLLLITNNVAISTTSIQDDGEYTFLVFSDLHLGVDCFRNDGTLDEDKLSERINAFEMFKNKLITELKENGIPVAGIIFTGDILDAFTKHQSNFKVNNIRRDYLTGKVVELARRESLNVSNDNEFVVGILGNHEMTMGTDYASCCLRMQDVVSSIFTDEAKIIGAGYARIRVGNDFISIIHSAANDYSDSEISYPMRTTNRDREEHFILLYEEYMLMCKKVMEDYERDNPGKNARDYFTTHLNQKEKVGNDLRSEQTKINLFQYVNQKLKKENSELYEFYKPFITCDRDYTTDNITDKSRMFSFFEMHMAIDSLGELGTVSQFKYGSRSFEKIGFDVNGYEIYFKRNSLMAKSDGISGINPFVSRSDDYMSVLSLVGHHHRKSDIDGGDLVRVSNEYLEDDRLHVTSIEPASIKERFRKASDSTTRVSEGYIFEATRVTININEGQVMRIALQPEQMIVSRNPNGVLVIEGNNLVRSSSKETSFNK